MAVRPMFFLFLSGVVLFAGCDSERDVDEEALKAMAGGELKERVPVSGTVTIDGQPAAGVSIYAYTRESGMEPARQCRTKDDGTYCWSTHSTCDGLPPGSYRLAFAHIPKERRGDEGKDLLKGKYRNPLKNDFPLEVESGKPQTEVNYDLVTGK